MEDCKKLQARYPDLKGICRCAPGYKCYFLTCVAPESLQGNFFIYDRDLKEWLFKGDDEFFKNGKRIKDVADGEKKFVFITIQDFQRRVSDLEALQSFIKSISYMYSEGQWIIETGKREKDFNVHIHLLVKIRPQVKNHKKVMNTKWQRHFATNLYDKDYYDIKQHQDVESMPSYSEWVSEKKDYFINDLKGSHKNTVDLNLNGVF